MVNHFYLILFFWLTFLFPKTLHYEISFMGLTAATVHIEITDTTYLGNVAHKIEYNTQTVSFIGSVFAVNNNYQTITNDDFTQILKFTKKSQHPGLDDELNAEINPINDMLIYSVSKKEVPSEIFNIFSLFHYIQSPSFHINHELRKFKVDREGTMYQGELTLFDENPGEYIFNLNLEEITDTELENRKTDIFTWAVYLKNSKRKLVINRTSGVLESCSFSRRFVSLKAHLICVVP